ncbi:MAG: hypothetical protein U0W24_04440 [Bacteroidales bacterium]
MGSFRYDSISISKDSGYVLAMKFILKLAYKNRFGSRKQLSQAIVHGKPTHSQEFLVIDFRSFSFVVIEKFLLENPFRIKAEIIQFRKLIILFYLFLFSTGLNNVFEMEILGLKIAKAKILSYNYM